MVTVVQKKPSVLAMFGKGLGEGIQEHVPKEIERRRLASSLKDIGDNPDLSPFQRFAALASAPGATPQIVQSGTELLKQQGLRNNMRRGQPAQGQAQRQEDPRVEAAMQQFDNRPRSKAALQSQEQPGENVPRESLGQEQIQPKNPLREEVKTYKPPTPQEFEDRLSSNWDRFPELTYPEVAQKTQQDFDRLSALPEAERAEDARLRDTQDRIKTSFDDTLQKKLHKDAAGTLKDVSGETQVNLLRGLERDIAKNGISEDDAVNKWTNKALDIAKAKTDLNKLMSGHGALTSFFKQDEFIEKLQNFQKIYRDADNLEEFYNLLSGTGMSPQARAQVAWPRSDSVKKLLKNHKPLGYFGQIENSKKLAMQIEDAFTRDDSFLAIAKNLKDIDPNFNERGFFQQLSDDADKLGLSPRQKRELAEGVSDLIPNWADTWFFPNSRGLNK
jgi:hypothetical protein